MIRASYRKSIDTTEKSALKLVKLTNLKVIRLIQERIKGKEKASPIHTLFHIGNSSRVVFKTIDPKGD